MKKHKHMMRRLKKAYRKYVEREISREVIALDIDRKSLWRQPLKMGDKLLNPSDSMSAPVLGTPRPIREVQIEYCYFKASYTLFNLIKWSDNYNVKDGFLFPALFCLRQYVETAIKSSLYYFRLSSGEVAEIEHTHSLSVLWKELSSYISPFNEEVACVESIIQELDSYVHTAFRYQFAFDKDTLSKDDYPNITTGGIDVTVLQERMIQIYHVLEGINELARQARW